MLDRSTGPMRVSPDVSDRFYLAGVAEMQNGAAVIRARRYR